MREYIDIKLIKYLSTFYGVAVLIKFGKQVYWKSTIEGSYKTLTWFQLFLHEAFIDWGIVVLFMIFISYLTARLISKKKHWWKFILLHIILSFILGTINMLLRTVGYGILEDTNLIETLHSIPFRQYIGLMDKYFLVYFSMVGIVYVYYYIKKVKNIELQKSKLQGQLANSKLNALKAQIHPHFIFNSLNSISSLIEIDPGKSQNLIADFGDLFREIITFKDQDLIPLKKELYLLNKYIDIISVRFSDHLVITQNIEPGLDAIQVPSFSIQPLLENSVKHGYAMNHTELEINITIKKENRQLCIIINNNGTPLYDDFETLLTKGTGLKNTYERLKTQYGTDFKFNLKNKPNEDGVTAFIRIPLDFEGTNY